MLLMEPKPAYTNGTDVNGGLLAGVTAFVIWGFFPIYFKAIGAVGALEVLSHRVVWSVPFCLVIILARKQWPQIMRALKTPKVLGLLALSSAMIAINWGTYIWAVQQDQIFQASLAYYMNPLMYIVVGVVFFGEKLTHLQRIAVALAALGVTILTLKGGAVPYLALIMAVSWTIYGVVRKMADVGSLPGLLLETALLLPPALFYMAYLAKTGVLAFGPSDMNLALLLLAAGPLTVLPLFAFTYAAKKLQLSTLGFLQYIGPTLQFCCAVYYGEAFTPAHAWCFGLIWTAVILFMWDRFRERPAKLKS